MIFYPFLASLSGYSIGRIGHIIGGQVIWIPHHWIFGLIIIAIPLLWRKIPKNIKAIIILFGIGVFISDFKDFLSLETFSLDNVKVVKFWGID